MYICIYVYTFVQQYVIGGGKKGENRIFRAKTTQNDLFFLVENFAQFEKHTRGLISLLFLDEN